MNSSSSNFFDFCISTEHADALIKRALAAQGHQVVNTLNAHSFNVAIEDQHFHDSLVSSDVLVADGIGIVWAAKLFGNEEIFKVSGYDLFVAAMAIANRDALTVGFLGSTPDVLDRIQRRVNGEYPKVRAQYH